MRVWYIYVNAVKFHVTVYSLPFQYVNKTGIPCIYMWSDKSCVILRKYIIWMMMYRIAPLCALTYIELITGKCWELAVHHLLVHFGSAYTRLMHMPSHIASDITIMIYLCIYICEHTHDPISLLRKTWCVVRYFTISTTISQLWLDITLYPPRYLVQRRYQRVRGLGRLHWSVHFHEFVASVSFEKVLFEGQFVWDGYNTVGFHW